MTFFVLSETCTLNLQLLTHSHLLSAAFWSCSYIKTTHKLTPTEDAPIAYIQTIFPYRLRQEATTEYLPPIQASTRSTARILITVTYKKRHLPRTVKIHITETQSKTCLDMFYKHCVRHEIYFLKPKNSSEQYPFICCCVHRSNTQFDILNNPIYHIVLKSN